MTPVEQEAQQQRFEGFPASITSILLLPSQDLAKRLDKEADQLAVRLPGSPNFLKNGYGYYYYYYYYYDYDYDYCDHYY